MQPWNQFSCVFLFVCLLLQASDSKEELYHTHPSEESYVHFILEFILNNIHLELRSKFVLQVKKSIIWLLFRER